VEFSVLYEAHLVVRDLQASARFYESILGFTPALATPDVRFYWTGHDRRHMFALWQLKPDDHEPRKHTGPDVSTWARSHLAFHLALPDFWIAIENLKRCGIEVRGFDGETDEPSVHTWVPALSVYFPDPDGHALEFISVLDEQPRLSLGVISWSEWNRMNA